MGHVTFVEATCPAIWGRTCRDQPPVPCPLRDRIFGTPPSGPNISKNPGLVSISTPIAVKVDGATSLPIYLANSFRGRLINQDQWERSPSTFQVV